MKSSNSHTTKYDSPATKYANKFEIVVKHSLLLAARMFISPALYEENLEARGLRRYGRFLNPKVLRRDSI